MKRSVVSSAVFLALISLGVPVKAQTPEQVLQACANNQAQALPIVFTDVPPTHWAFEDVMTMYYCGIYRGSIAREELIRRSQPQSVNERHEEIYSTVKE